MMPPSASIISMEEEHMTKICPSCGEATGFRSFLIRVTVLPGEEGEAEEKAIKALSTRDRAKAMIEKSSLTAGEGER
jgi:hypothetical protein